MISQNALLTDKDLAQICGMSPSWVRQQRYRRRHGMDHALTIDPVMIGRCPRYKAQEVEEWISSLH